MQNLFIIISCWIILANLSSCVVEEHPYHHHHDRVYIEEVHPVVEEKVEIR